MLFELSALFDMAQNRRLDAGANVFRAGAHITHFYFVRDGCAVLLRSLANGDTAYLQRARAGDVVAEASVYASRYHCDCTVTEQTVLAALPRQVFRRALQADAEASEIWAAHLAWAVQSTRMRA